VRPVHDPRPQPLEPAAVAGVEEPNGPVVHHHRIMGQAGSGSTIAA
jgi:hypothetical protein